MIRTQFTTSRQSSCACVARNWTTSEASIILFLLTESR